MPRTSILVLATTIAAIGLGAATLGGCQGPDAAQEASSEPALAPISGGTARLAQREPIGGSTPDDGEVESRQGESDASADVGVARGFRPALAPYFYEFPRDHGPHPEFATEWWYYTGHLLASDGRRFGYQLTWFRSALAPSVERASRWAARDLMFAHFALTDESGRRFFFSDRIGRANLGLAGAQLTPDDPSAHARIWCNDWHLVFAGRDGDEQLLRARGESDAPGTRDAAFGLDLRQRALRPPVMHGKDGVSPKAAGPGRASHYYSFTRLETAGTLELDGERIEVTGQSWFDHEFGSSVLTPEQIGWDWFSLHLDDGRDLMLFQLRLRDGGIEPMSSGTLVAPDGTSQHVPLADFELEPRRFWTSPQTGARYPILWRVRVPSAGLDFEVEASMPEQELRPARSGAGLTYWEGSVTARPTSGAASETQATKARGYLEMTGYAEPFAAAF